MIISFSAENYRSIKDRQDLILEATLDHRLEHSHVLEHGKHRILKSAGIYGANASGKSNVLSGISLMKDIVNTSVSERLNRKLTHQPFALSTDTNKAATVFELVFMIDDIQYRYGFSYSEKVIESEWLYEKPNGRREVYLFKRDSPQRSTIKINIKKFTGKEFITMTQPEYLFLRVCAEWGEPISSNIFKWFQKLRSISGLNESFINYTGFLLSQESHRHKLTSFIKQAGIYTGKLNSNKIKLDEIELPLHISKEDKDRLIKNHPDFYQIFVEHDLLNEAGKITGTVEFDLEEEESEGTRKFIAMSGPLHHVIKEGSTLVIDELEAKLHPNLTKAIIRWFHGPNNNKGAQLIFATHDTGIMEPDILRRDQVWFCEKDESGATALYSLAEFDSDKVRPTTKFNKHYLQGVFGAVPKLALND